MDILSLSLFIVLVLIVLLFYLTIHVGAAGVYSSLNLLLLFPQSLVKLVGLFERCCLNKV